MRGFVPTPNAKEALWTRKAADGAIEKGDELGTDQDRRHRDVLQPRGLGTAAGDADGTDS